jgi:hypothetical protein
VSTVAATGAPLVLTPPAARADVYYFNHPGGGDFNSSSDPYLSWLDTTTSLVSDLPTNGSDVVIARTGTVGLSGITVNQNAIYSGTGLSSLSIDSQNTLSQTNAASVMIAAGESIGSTAAASFNLAAGKNVANTLAVGNWGAPGSLGTMTQSGGTNIVTGTLELGFWSTSAGTYTLSAGTLLATNVVSVGLGGGTGSFAQLAGTATIGQLNLGDNSTSGVTTIGNYNLSGGSLTVTTGASIGLTGIGRFTQSGGVSLLAGLIVGDQSNSMGTSNGSYSLLGNGLLTVSNSAIIGNFGTGNFSQTGGVFTINGTGSNGLYVGFATASVGSYSLGGGLLNAVNGEQIGANGTGTFTQTAGTNTTGSMIVGTNYGASGTYTLGGGNLAVSGDMIVGERGVGSFSQTNGAVSASNLFVGRWDNGTNQAGTGTYNLSSGFLTVTNQTAVGGWSGNGTFNQTGGTHTTGSLILGEWSNGTVAQSTGLYKLSDGTLNAGTEYISIAGPGSFKQTGGTNTAIYLDVGRAGTNLGTYELRAGATLNMTGGSVGYQGNGIDNIFGGTFNVGVGTNGGPGLFLGYQPGASGTVNQSGGTINNLAGGTIVGLYGSGTFNQSGGVNNAGFFTLGNWGSAVGNYNLSNGATLNMTGGNIAYAGGTLGNFNMTGGACNVSNGATVSDLLLGYYPSATGTANVSGGVFTTYNGDVTVGYGGTGVFNQSGGTVNISNWLYIGDRDNTTGVGTYNLSGGTLNASFELVGGLGTGTFNQTGGYNFVSFTNGMAIGFTPVSNVASNAATYNLSGGWLSANVTNNGSFNLSGNGTFISGTVTNNGRFNYGGGSFWGGFVQGQLGVFNFTGGANSFTAGSITNNGSLAIYGGQSIISSTIVDNEGQVYLEGGSLTGSNILNNGLIQGLGTLSTLGGMINAGSIEVTGNLALAGGTSATVVNNGAITLALARQLQLGAPLVNNGSLNIGGGIINGAMGLTNAAGGVVTGPGMISAPFTNIGTIVLPVGTLNIASPWTNTGSVQITVAGANLGGAAMTNDAMVELSAPGATFSSAAINNAGTIQGVGTVANPVTNNGSIEAIGGTLAFNAPLKNTAEGVLRVTTGNKLLLTNGFSGSNQGLISLVGGTFDTNGNPLGNLGSIAGFGVLSTGGLNNAAGNVITFSGGFTTVNGDVSNRVNATIRAALTPVLFTGNVTNNGTIKVTGAPTNTVTIAGTYGGIGSYISDPADNYFLGNASVSEGGLISGGVGDRFFMYATYNNAGVYDNAGGSLLAQNVVNDGTFTQAGGQATMLALSGTGSTTVGGGGGTTLASAASLSQGSVTVNAGGTLLIRPAASRLTNLANNLQINGTGTLDMGNHELLTNTTPATIKGYLAQAYDATGNQDWGKPGLTSSVARANPTSYSVGYAYGGDQSAQDAGVTTKGGTPLGPNQTVVRPVLVGDANMDGSVDFFDITQILGYKYNTGQAASYTDGDLDYSGKVDFFDIVLLLSANYNSGQTYLGAHAAAAPAASPTLSGVAIASATTAGTTGDGKPDFEYDPATGHLRFRTDGGTFTTTGGSASFVSSLTISSAAGILAPGGASSAFAGGTGATITSTLLSSALTNSPGFTDGFDIGLVLAPGLGLAALTTDLTVKYQSLNGGSLKTADVTLIPEPSDAALVALGLAAAGAANLPRRRRRRLVKCSPIDARI